MDTKLIEMVKNEEGTYVQKIQSLQEIEIIYSRLFGELYHQRKARLPSTDWAWKYLLSTGIKSHVKGIKRISGAGDNITILLEKELKFEDLKKVIEKNQRYYWHKENICGDKFHQIRREGHVYTLGFPIVALDSLYDGRDTIEIRKGLLNILFGTLALSGYLKERHGEFSLKSH